MIRPDAITTLTRPIRARGDGGVRLGTGFGYRIGERHGLVTSKHVVQDARVDGVLQVVPHPDPTIDLAWLEVIDPPAAVLDASNVHDHVDLGAVERVLVPGHPLGLEGPIVRSGITATDPKRPWQGQAAFLVDMPCHPGTSGAPVFRDDNGALSLIGVIIGGPALRDDARDGVLADWPRGDTFHLGIALDARRLWAWA